jgi:hypothetical protein
MHTKVQIHSEISMPKELFMSFNASWKAPASKGEVFKSSDIFVSNSSRSLEMHLWASAAMATMLPFCPEPSFRLSS